VRILVGRLPVRLFAAGFRDGPVAAAIDRMTAATAACAAAVAAAVAAFTAIFWTRAALDLAAPTIVFLLLRAKLLLAIEISSGESRSSR